MILTAVTLVVVSRLPAGGSREFAILLSDNSYDKWFNENLSVIGRSSGMIGYDLKSSADSTSLEMIISSYHGGNCRLQPQGTPELM